MAKKKEEASGASNSNVSNNTNNSSNANSSNNVNNNNNHVSVHVNVPYSQSTYKEEKKPNWIVKAIVVAIIGAVVAYFSGILDGGHGSPPAEEVPRHRGVRVN